MKRKTDNPCQRTPDLKGTAWNFWIYPNGTRTVFRQNEQTERKSLKGWTVIPYFRQFRYSNRNLFVLNSNWIQQQWRNNVKRNWLPFEIFYKLKKFLLLLSILILNYIKDNWKSNIMQVIFFVEFTIRYKCKFNKMHDKLKAMIYKYNYIYIYVLYV